MKPSFVLRRITGFPTKKTAEQTGRLQVVQSFDQNPKTIQDAAGKLLNAISVKPSNASVMLAGAMLKSKTPITENDIKTAVRWMDTLPVTDTKKPSKQFYLP